MELNKSNIMVATDGSQASKQAFFQAVEFFEYKNIFNQIIVTHVSNESKTYLPFEFQSTTIYEDYKTELLSRYPEANYQLVFQEKAQGQENVRNQILSIAGDLNVSYLIVGFNGRKGVKQDVTILGQTVRNSVYNSKVPLIAVKKLYKRDETNGFKFVVCIDGSKKSYKSLENAIALSFDERDSLLICFAPTPDREAFGTTIKTKVEEFMGKYQRKWQYKQLDASYRAIENVIEMINNSDDLDFVVFGSNGYRAQLENKTFFGSTADELLKKAKANIIMVP
ncbi:unnamed protein product [Paramecium pentaurelia]|uniref:UspA domain-containing protein n=1 Tax=Paramecium pentaurelia TaxID=43138 RepID=A0A8S1W778_9CILI|nr:unnamed protein product [Paramecium pentaurelia]